MKQFCLLILHLLAEQPHLTIPQAAEHMAISPQGMGEIVDNLVGQALLLPTESGWYLTFLGQVALAEFDMEQERRKLQRHQQAIATICQALQVEPGEIRHFSPLTQGMTNESYRFTAAGGEYIYRMPGEGTSELVNRRQEYAVYQLLAGRGIGDTGVYYDPDSGIKITEFLTGCHGPDPKNWEDVSRCMAELRRLHTAGIPSPHPFSHRETIRWYEGLCQRLGVSFDEDHQELQRRILALLDRLAALPVPRCLCHIDSVPGNFLLGPTGEITLIDWEYAGEAEPLVDPAMWCLSAAYSPQECDRLLVEYLGRPATLEEQLRFYGWIAAGGFLWSLWGKYKASLGEDFGEYEARQLSYARGYTQRFEQLGQTIQEDLK